MSFTNSINSSIQVIDKVTVNKICSGQVVLNLATAVKELVENSLDAGATSIQIRLQEYGSEFIEVVDNGSGIEDNNFQALTLKHYTSKLKDFDELFGVETFGFRGEALSSLCTLCGNVTITTRHKTALQGTKITYDNNGIITKRTSVARQVGTTVCLENIFSTLPVRHKEFQRNLKKEFVKMCNVLNGYCLQVVGVSINCKNKLKCGRTTTVVEIQGDSIKANIQNIFGAKQIQTLLEFLQIRPDAELLSEFGLAEDKRSEQFQLMGYISSCVHGMGRSAADRQFIFINSRPVDHAKITRLINEVYHSYNPKQYPFVCLNIDVNKTLVDVNVTPDKRQMFIDNEKLLLATIKASLIELYKKLPSTLTLQTLTVPNLNNTELLTTNKLIEFKHQFSLKRSSEDKESSKSKQPKLDNFFARNILKKSEDNQEKIMDNQVVEDNVKKTCDIEVFALPKVRSYSMDNKLKIVENMNINIKNCEDLEKTVGTEEKETNLNTTSEIAIETKNEKTPKKIPNFQKCDEGINEEYKTRRKTIITNIDLATISQKFKKIKKTRIKSENIEVKFHAKLDNSDAEQELRKEINTEMFKNMKILGQFNLGFIITQFGSDLFIIDQHATDEKYNFEMLQKNTVMNTQKLLVPRPLQLTLANEELLLENIDIFKKNGFDFVFNEEEVATKRLKLSVVPFSRNCQFGKEDVDELLFMLSDASGTMCRPTRVRGMFASRACRMSVMVGTALTTSEMRKLVNHMGDIEQPWNCPHGRPTIRHLVNLDMIQPCEQGTQ